MRPALWLELVVVLTLPPVGVGTRGRRRVLALRVAVGCCALLLLRELARIRLARESFPPATLFELLALPPELRSTPVS